MQETHRNRFRAISLGGKICIFSSQEKQTQKLSSFVSPICFQNLKNLVKSKGVENLGIIFCSLFHP
jgi:hypothetical protein